MSQSANVTAEQTRNIPEHVAETAATNHGKGTHLTAHEETVREKEHTQNEAHNQVHEQAMSHGKAQK